MHGMWSSQGASGTKSFTDGTLGTFLKLHLQNPRVDFFKQRAPPCRFPGGLKERPAKMEFQKDPGSILHRAVYGMLPKNKLRRVSKLVYLCSLSQPARLSCPVLPPIMQSFAIVKIPVKDCNPLSPNGHYKVAISLGAVGTNCRREHSS